MKVLCKYCGYDAFEERPSPPHVGLYCLECGKWQQWVKHKENIETGEVATEAQQKYALSLMTKWKHSGLPMTARQAGGIISLFRGDSQ